MLNINPVCKSPSFGTLGVMLPDNPGQEVKAKFEATHAFFSEIENKEEIRKCTTSVISVSEIIPPKNKITGYKHFTVSLTAKPAYVLKKDNKSQILLSEQKEKINSALQGEEIIAKLIEEKTGLTVKRDFDSVKERMREKEQVHSLKNSLFTDEFEALVQQQIDELK